MSRMCMSRRGEPQCTLHAGSTGRYGRTGRTAIYDSLNETRHLEEPGVVLEQGALLLQLRNLELDDLPRVSLSLVGLQVRLPATT